MSENIDLPYTAIENGGKCQKRKQYLACITMSFLCLSKGVASSWSSPMISLLQSADSPVGKMDDSQINVLVSIAQYAGIASAIIVVYALIKWGTKVSCYLQAAMSIVGWVFLICANSSILVYIGRFFIATSIVGVDILAAFYMSEVSSDSIRGTLISLLTFSGNLGSLLAYALGTVTNFRLFNAFGLIPVALFPLCFYWFPETPAQHAIRGRTNEAVQSYAWFQNVPIADADSYVKSKLLGRRPNFSPRLVMREKSNRIALYVLIFMIMYVNFCGVTVIGNYMSKIFEIADCSLTPNQSALMVAAVVFVSSLIGAVLIDWTGRRFLVILAMISMTIFQCVLIAYFVLKEYKLSRNIRSYEWAVYLGLGGFSAANAIGISSVAPTIGAEMVPAGVKGILWGIAGILSLLSHSVIVFIYQFTTDHTMYYVNFVQAAVFGLVGVVIAWLLIPETKGKSLEQITAELSR
ncbi:sugar transporter [Nesidiocoris tenuis]|uniref:Sugar transporter n=1 Tax=Nesidiocoris tenuis TaxID=355587 RepID=A0ABN7AWF9_9HEMI|nr:sugar transporter [Nesidiocoris tenuis]